MFESLATAVDTTEIPTDPDALREIFSIRDRLDARIATAVGEFDAAGLFDLDGDVTMQSWLRHQTGRDQPTANRLTMAGRKLRALPLLTEHFEAGRLTGGQVEIILANIRLRHLELFAGHEAALLPLFEGLGIDELRAAMLAWKAKADALDDEKPPPEHENEAYLSTTIDGRGELRASMNSDMTAAIEAALRVADSRDRDLTLAERRADALETVARFFLDNQQTCKGGRHRPHLNVSMTYEEFVNGLGGTYMNTGQPVGPAECGVLRCDSALHRLLVDGRSSILYYGRARRLVPPDLFQALFVRDRGCRFPGCDRPAHWTDAHHVHEWELGGLTNLDNLVLLCRRHHRKLHRRDYSAKLLPDATFEVTYPDAHTETSDARGPVAQQFWRPADGG